MDFATVDDDENTIQLDMMVVTTILSIILYGRQAFPENCFRKLSSDDLEHPRATHKDLIRSGRPLSYKDGPLHYLSADEERLVYLRECNDPQLRSLLATLDQIFVALADGIIGKIYVCFNDTNQWSKDSLLECYTIQFSYTELGGVQAFVHWAGKGDAPSKECDPARILQSLKQVVLGRPQLPDPFYTRFFVSAINRQTELQGSWAGDIHGVREALRQFKTEEGSSSCRIGRFNTFISQEATQEADDADDRYLPGVSPRVTTPSLPELFKSPIAASRSSELNLLASPARPSSTSNESRSQRSFLARSYKDSVGPISLLRASPYPDKGHADGFSTDGDGQNADIRAQQTLLRRNPKKRSAPQDQSVPVTQAPNARAAVAANHPRLVMIERIPEDLPPTQRLPTPSQSRQALRSTCVDPAFLSTDSEESQSPRAKRRQARQALRSTYVDPAFLSTDSEESQSPPAKYKRPAVLGNAGEEPEETWQAAGQSHSPQKANTSRVCGSRSERGGKRARTIA